MGCGSSSAIEARQGPAKTAGETAKAAGETEPNETGPQEIPEDYDVLAMLDHADPDLSWDRPAEERLQELLGWAPFVEHKEHALNSFVLSCREAMREGSSDDAHHAIDHLVLAFTAEEKASAAAFARFDKNRNGKLDRTEVSYMMDYLGYPCSPEDCKEFFQALDDEEDGKVTFKEFIRGVGRVGGTKKLFAQRRRQIEARTLNLDKEHESSKEDLRLQLRACGISEEEQTIWEVVMDGAELAAAAELTSCQKDAVRHIRDLARRNHKQALPLLQKRFEGLGYSSSDMWMTLAWIRELAPVTLHIDLDKITPFLLSDTHYRNQFETSSSSGILNVKVRKKWEKDLFGSSYDIAEPFERPKYGVQNVWNDPRGVRGCVQYGDSYLVLKNVRLRSTVSPEDSGNLKATRLAVLDYYAHVLQEYSDDELLMALRVAQGGHEHLGDSDAVIEKWGKYKEAQIHGPIDLSKHVDRLVASERHRYMAGELQEVADKHGFTLTWVEEMKTELQAKSAGEEQTREQFNGTLQKLQSWSNSKLEAPDEAQGEAATSQPAPGAAVTSQAAPSKAAAAQPAADSAPADAAASQPAAGGAQAEAAALGPVAE
eukprot:TRINITY_DN29706_c0_g1_i1.p1 TRINITY_DN29706_c0_g1~~TRINITY_DN29706_c0_g1_i1.p1  ORF type:complete len:600 (-),score=152.74 TRINITY_DN29706_c0_g1_i1:40-1839(-)